MKISGRLHISYQTRDLINRVIRSITSEWSLPIFPNKAFPQYFETSLCWIYAKIHKIFKIRHILCDENSRIARISTKTHRKWMWRTCIARISRECWVAVQSLSRWERTLLNQISDTHMTIYETHVGSVNESSEKFCVWCKRRAEVSVNSFRTKILKIFSRLGDTNITPYILIIQR